MRRALATGAVVAVVVSSVLAGAGAAGAAASVTVTPDEDLVDLQVVDVDGSGFEKNTDIGLMQCKSNPSGWNDCDFRTVDGDTTGSAGGFHDDFEVRRVLDTANGEVDCALKSCVIAVGNLYAFGQTVRARIGFDPDVPPAPPLTVYLRVAEQSHVEASSGEVTLLGEYRCNRKTPNVYIDAYMTQAAGRSLIEGYGFSGYQQLLCKKTYQPFELEIYSYNGIFKAGNAHVFTYMYAYDDLEYDDESVEVDIKLTGS